MAGRRQAIISIQDVLGYQRGLDSIGQGVYLGSSAASTNDWTWKNINFAP